MATKKGAITTTTTTGNIAESKAWSYLESQGCKLIQRNFHSKSGEIDLIVEDNGTLVFVEVRYRSNISRGTGAESITRQKIRRIIMTAEYFLLKHKQFKEVPSRFDVISIDESIDWIKRAFTLDY